MLPELLRVNPESKLQPQSKTENLLKIQEGHVFRQNETVRMGQVRDIINGAKNQKAVFLPQFADFLNNCNISVEFVNPVPIGKGANHFVYEYSPPGQEKQVIKIPRNDSISTLSKGRDDEAKQITLIRNYFPAIMLPTEIRSDEKSDQYLILQKAVKGKPVSNRSVNEKTRKELREIVALNHKFMAKENASLDFVGMPGFLSWFKKQAGKLIQRRSEFEISNLLVDDESGKIYLIDYDILRFNNVSLKQKITSYLGFIVNRLLMKHYFGEDIKRNNKSSPQRTSFALQAA